MDGVKARPRWRRIEKHGEARSFKGKWEIGRETKQNIETLSREYVKSSIARVAFNKGLRSDITNPSASSIQ